MNLPFYAAMADQIRFSTADLGELYEALLVEDHSAHELTAVKAFRQMSRGAVLDVCDAVADWAKLRGWGQQEASLADLHARVQALQAADDPASQADAEALDRLRTALVQASMPPGVMQASRATVKR